MTTEQLTKFWAQVDKNGPVPAHRPDLGPCWIWQGSRDIDGYGRFSYDGKQEQAHRIPWRLKNGDIPPRHVSDHLCLVTSCVNDAHVEMVTQRVNILRGTSAAAVNARKTHCVNGHALEGKNLYTPPRGGRYCRQCGRDAELRHREREYELGKRLQAEENS